MKWPNPLRRLARSTPHLLGRMRFRPQRTHRLFVESLEPRTLLASLPTPFELSSLLAANGGDGTQGVVFNGLEVSDHTGWSVAGAGDINGDGFDDLLIVAMNARPANGSVGATYVVFGRSGPFSPEFDLLALNGTDGFAIGGGPPDSSTAWSASSAGDVNGDGFDDIVIGTGFFVDTAGAAFVVFGHSGSFPASLDVLSLDGASGFTINGRVDDGAGYSVAGAGDVNNDGFDDVLIGAPGANENRGAGYIVFGHSGSYSSSFNVSALDGANGFAISFNALDPGEGAGWSVAGAGDVNADGADDLVISNAFADEGGVVVIFGHVGTFPASLDASALDGMNGFVFRGQPGDTAGYSVSGSGDVNSDGIDDLLIGAMTANNSSGAGYVVFGRETFGPVIPASALDGSAGFKVIGMPNEFIGQSVSGAGDVNGDGVDDVWVGGMGVKEFVGGGYVVFGSTEPFSATVDVALLDGTNGFAVWGVAPGDMAGWSADMGDFNGDGGADLLIGAFNANGGTGAAYVVFGQPSQVNTPPSIGAFTTDSPECGGAVENELVTVAGTFTDPDAGDSHLAMVDWGDGQQSAAEIIAIDGVYHVTATHAYAQGGVYSVNLVVTDSESATATAAAPAIVSGAGISASGVLYVIGTSDKDHVEINKTDSHIEVHASFLADKKRSFAPAEVTSMHVILCGGDDHAAIDDSVAVMAIVDGGEGDDHLSGGQFAVLTGSEGHDQLRAGSGRSLLIGGAGRDHVMGQSGDDILIAGTADVESDVQALDAIMAQWRRTDLDYATRVASLSPLLNAVTVYDDGDDDTVTGGKGLDWFFASLDGDGDRWKMDNVTDLRSDEVAIDLDEI